MLKQILTHKNAFMLYNHDYCRNVTHYFSSCPVSIVLQSCTLSFAATTPSNEGSYVLTMYMEDYPINSIILTPAGGDPVDYAPSDFLSRIQLQVVVKGTPYNPQFI